MTVSLVIPQNIYLLKVNCPCITMRHYRITHSPRGSLHQRKVWEIFKFRSQLDECTCIYFFQIDLTKIEKPESWLMLVGNMETGEEGGDRFHLMSQMPSILLYFWLVKLALELVLWLFVFTDFVVVCFLPSIFRLFSLCGPGASRQKWFSGRKW